MSFTFAATTCRFKSKGYIFVSFIEITAVITCKLRLNCAGNDERLIDSLIRKLIWMIIN